MELVHENKCGRAVGIHRNRIIDVPLDESIALADEFDKKLYDFNNDVLSRF